MKWLDKVPFLPVLVGALTLGLAPFVPQPHLFEKLAMLFSGSLQRPVDIFDLLMHGALPLLLLLKTLRVLQTRGQ